MKLVLGVLLGLFLLATVHPNSSTSAPPATTAPPPRVDWCKPLLPDTGNGHGRIIAVPVTTPDGC